MMCPGNSDNGTRMYSSRSSSVHRCIFFMSTNICFALMVLMMLFHSILEVVRSTVLVVSLPGYLMRFMPAVILTRLGSVFCGQ